MEFATVKIRGWNRKLTACKRWGMVPDSVIGFLPICRSQYSKSTSMFQSWGHGHRDNAQCPRNSNFASILLLRQGGIQHASTISTSSHSKRKTQWARNIFGSRIWINLGLTSNTVVSWFLLYKGSYFARRQNGYHPNWKPQSLRDNQQGKMAARWLGKVRWRESSARWCRDGPREYWNKIKKSRLR